METQPEMTQSVQQPDPQPSQLPAEHATQRVTNARRRWFADPRALVALVVVVVAGLAVYFIERGGSGRTSLPAIGTPAAVSESQLKALAAKTDHPVYWAGRKSGAYELTRTAGGRIYIRYLPSSGKVGTKSPNYLTVGTYPDPHAFRSIRRAAARKGGIALKIGGGGVAVFNEKTPTSVYFGYPGAKYQVEVYDPSPLHARALVLAGKIKPVE